MQLNIFENKTGEGIVSFLPWYTGPPKIDTDPSRWYCHLSVAGERVFEFGSPCGTCGIVFRKVGSAADRVSDAEAVQLLGTLDTLPPFTALQRLARILEPGLYFPVIIEGLVQRVEPGTPQDYFATDVVRLFGPESVDAPGITSPNTLYYRFGLEHELDRTGRTTGPHKALVTALVLPIQDVTQLNRDRVAFWKQRCQAGTPLTAFAVSIVDNQQPALAVPDPSYPYSEQFLVANCLLDGHHRLQAAAELGVPIRVLSLVTQKYSLTRHPGDTAAALARYAR